MQGAVCGVHHLFPHLHAAIVPYPYSGHKISRDNKKVPPDSFPVGGKMLALPIFPGRRQPSIVGRDELNYRVRNGNGWTLILISTNYMSSSAARKQTILYCPLRLLSRHFLSGDPYRIRTDVNGVRGRCLNHLTNGPWCAFTDSNRGPTD